MADTDRFQAKIEEWLKLNREQWELLTQHGVEEGTELELDYNFSASDEASARAFAKEFDQRFGTESSAELLPEDDEGNPALWVICGTTAPTPSSLDSLDLWIREIVNFGATHNCLFEGWGAYPPNAMPQFSLGIGGFEVDDETKARFPKLLTVQVTENIEPIDRGEKYEDPLNEMLEAESLGKVVRSGSLCNTSEDGFEISGFEMTIRVADEALATDKIRSLLIKLGAKDKLTIEATDEDAVLEEV